MKYYIKLCTVAMHRRLAPPAHLVVEPLSQVDTLSCQCLLGVIQAGLEREEEVLCKGAGLEVGLHKTLQLGGRGTRRGRHWLV